MTNNNLQDERERVERASFEVWVTRPEVQLNIEHHPEYPRTYKDYTTAWAYSAYRAALASAEQAEPVAYAIQWTESGQQCQHQVRGYDEAIQWVRDELPVSAAIVPLFDRPAPSAVVEALRKYGKHLPDCMGGLSGKRECTCGLDAALIPPEAEQPASHVYDKDHIPELLADLDSLKAEQPAAKNEAQALDEQAKDAP